MSTAPESPPAPDSAVEDSAQAPASEEKSSGSGPLLGVLAFLLALGGGFLIGRVVQDQRAGPRVLDDDTRYDVDLRGDEPQLGPDDALVTIIEYADYQCPYCARAREPLEEAMAGFEDDVRLIYKHFPLPGHRLATPAAKAAWAAHQQGEFWAMHADLFAANSSVKGIEDRAAGLGLDPVQFMRDFGSLAAAESVDNDLLSGARLGVTGTPVFFVNGHRYVGFRDTAQWKDVIEFEAEHAENLVGGGTPRAEVYALLMKGAIQRRREGKADAKAPDPRPGGLDPSVVHRVDVEGRPAMGPADALVTVAVFSDFQCPYCARLAPLMRQLVDGQDDVRVVFLQLPIPSHRRARDAAKAALAAQRQGKFWEMHDLLFENRNGLSQANFMEYAESLELDVARFETDLSDDALEQIIAADEAAARGLKLSSTPSTFVNGRYVRGAVPLGTLVDVVDAERAAAQVRVDAGVPKADVYEAIMAEAAVASESAAP